MKRRNVLGVLVVLGLLGLAATAIVIAQQQVQLTSYYPAPYGEYVDLTFAGHLDAKGLAAVPAVSNAGEGRIYYDSGANKFKVSESGAAYVDLGGGGAGDWTRVAGPPSFMHPTNVADTIGIGTATPDTNYNLDVRGSMAVSEPAGASPTTTTLDINGGTFHNWAGGIADRAELRLNSPISYIQLSNWWRLGHFGSRPNLEFINFPAGIWNTVFTIWYDAPPNVLTVPTTGDVNLGYNLVVAGDITSGGTTFVPDYVFDPGYQLESIEEHADDMWKNKALKAVPPLETDETGNRRVNLTKTQLGVLEELEKAHIYIEQLNKRLKALEEKSAKEGDHETP